MRNEVAELEAKLEDLHGQVDELTRDLSDAMDRISDLEFALRSIKKDVEGIL
jgi:predicted  nucleic acid-binding Zn-ribbon protein